MGGNGCPRRNGHLGSVLFFKANEISELLVTILPSDNTFAAAQVVALIQFVAPVLIGLTLFDAFSYANDRQPVKAWPVPAWQHRIRLASFAILFATANPLVSFGLYFCGWHSIRGLIHLHQQFGGPIGRFSLSLVPITACSPCVIWDWFCVQPQFRAIDPRDNPDRVHWSQCSCDSAPAAARCL